MKDNEGSRYGMNKKLMQKRKHLERKLWNRGFGTETPYFTSSFQKPPCYLFIYFMSMS